MLSTYPPTCVKAQFPGAVIWKCAEQIWKVTQIRRGAGARRGRQLSPETRSCFLFFNIPSFNLFQKVSQLLSMSSNCFA